MGLAFTVGSPSDVFTEEFAERVRKTLACHFGRTIVLASTEEPYCSSELGWSGWRLLQDLAKTVLPADRLPHFLSMEAWCGCYVPAETDPGVFEFEGEPTPLAVASLGNLLDELEAIGRALDLPLDTDQLHEWARRYDEDEHVDEDPEFQTFIQLLLAAREAQRSRQVLWIVK